MVSIFSFQTLLFGLRNIQLFNKRIISRYGFLQLLRDVKQLLFQVCYVAFKRNVLYTVTGIAYVFGQHGLRPASEQ